MKPVLMIKKTITYLLAFHSQFTIHNSQFSFTIHNSQFTIFITPVQERTLHGFSAIDNNAGIANNTNRVENLKPKTIEMAIGIKNCAGSDFSKSRGIKPKIVVNEVSNTARKR